MADAAEDRLFNPGERLFGAMIGVIVQLISMFS
jgi:hypothetical protein